MNSFIRNLTHHPVSGDYLNLESVKGLPAQDSGKILYLCPGLADLQVNGFHGVNLAEDALQPEQVILVCQELLKEGVTRWCPTIVTSPFQRTLANIRAIIQACKMDTLVRSSVLGIHLEGPYISPVTGYRGAHNLESIRKPDWNEFCAWQEAAEGSIRLVTLAPEVEGSLPFIRQAAASGVVIGLGHTNASPEEIYLAVESGATFATHLGNGLAAEIHRHNNPVWSLLANDSLYAGAIFDGFHLPTDLMRVIYRVKGKGKTILTSDTTSFAKMQPGVYETTIGGKVEYHENGKLTMYGSEDYLAGSASTLKDCIEKTVEILDIPIEEALEMAYRTPRTLFNQGYDHSEVLLLWNSTTRRLEALAAGENGKIIWEKP